MIRFLFPPSGFFGVLCEMNQHIKSIIVKLFIILPSLNPFSHLRLSIDDCCHCADKNENFLSSLFSQHSNIRWSFLFSTFYHDVEKWKISRFKEIPQPPAHYKWMLMNFSPASHLFKFFIFYFKNKFFFENFTSKCFIFPREQKVFLTNKNGIRWILTCDPHLKKKVAGAEIGGGANIFHTFIKG